MSAAKSDVPEGGPVTEFTNCFVLKEDGRLVKQKLLIHGSRIIDPLHYFYVLKRRAEVVVDCHEGILAPGLIDIQFNGAVGVDFSQSGLDLRTAYPKLSDYLVSHGVTTIFPTMITCAREVYKKNIKELSTFKTDPNQCRIEKVHLEGPFLSEEKLGMHPKSLAKTFTKNVKKDLEETYGEDLSGVGIVTLAPELPNALEAIEWLSGNRGIKVSLGHTSADLAQTERAIQAGACLATHLFNAMRPFHHREPSVIGACLSKEGCGIHTCVIADLVHCHTKVLSMIERINPGKNILVTDSVIAAGLPDGHYKFGAQKIEIIRQTAYLSGTQNLAGSTANLLACIENNWREICSTYGEEEALARSIAAASTVPAKVVGLLSNEKEARGSLAIGSVADLVVLGVNWESKSLEVRSTWRDGKMIYAKG